MPVLRDALYNLNPDSGTNPEYARGILVGAMATLMEVSDCDFLPASKAIVLHMPKRVMRDAIPLPWRGQFGVLGVELV